MKPLLALLATLFVSSVGAQTIELTSRRAGEPEARTTGGGPAAIPNRLLAKRAQEVERRLKEGYTLKGELVYAFGRKNFLHRSPVINLSTGRVSSWEIQHHDNLYLAASAGKIRLSERPESSAWFDPFTRFVLLGRRTLAPDEPPDRTTSGAFTTDEGGVRYRIVWRSKGARTEIVAHALRFVGDPALIGRAVVTSDRSEGTLTRLRGNSVIAEESFRRIGPPPAMPSGFILPRAQIVTDERGIGEGRVASYPWPGYLPTPAEVAALSKDGPVSGWPPLVLAGIGTVVALILGTGIARLRRTRRNRAASSKLVSTSDSSASAPPG